MTIRRASAQAGTSDVLADLGGPRSARLAFTDAELAPLSRRTNPEPGLAARVLAKTLVLELLGGAGSGLTRDPERLREVQVLAGDSGRPSVVLADRPAHGSAAAGAQVIHVSMSHDGDMVAALVLIEDPD